MNIDVLAHNLYVSNGLPIYKTIYVDGAFKILSYHPFTLHKSIFIEENRFSRNFMRNIFGIYIVNTPLP